MSRNIDFFIGTTSDGNARSHLTVNTEFANGEYEWWYSILSDSGVPYITNSIPRGAIILEAGIRKKQQQ